MKYSEIRLLIRDGDAFLFRGHDWYSRAIRLWTISPYTHIALAFWEYDIDLGKKVLKIIEAVSGAGIRMMNIEDCLEDCNAAGIGVEWWKLTAIEAVLPLNYHHPIPRDNVSYIIDRTKVIEYAKNQLGKRYASPLQMISSFSLLSKFWHWLTKTKFTDTNEDRYFCSELAVSSWEAGGALKTKLAAASSPADTVKLPYLAYKCRVHYDG